MSDLKTFVCSSCEIETHTLHNLSGKKHVECNKGNGEWVKQSCPEDRHDYYKLFLNYNHCPYCGEYLQGENS